MTSLSEDVELSVIAVQEALSEYASLYSQWMVAENRAHEAKVARDDASDELKRRKDVLYKAMTNPNPRRTRLCVHGHERSHLHIPDHVVDIGVTYMDELETCPGPI